MNPKSLIVGALALAVGSYACGGNGKASAPETDDGPETSVSPLLPGSAAAGGTAASAGSACSNDQCPELRMFGNLVPGCCLGDDGCGGQVQLSERTWWCVPQSYDQAA